MMRRRDDSNVLFPMNRICVKCGESKPLTEFYWRKQNRLRRRDCKLCVRERRQGYYTVNYPAVRVGRHGMTIDQYNAMFAAQGYACAVCGGDNGGATFHIDHDHRCCPGRESCGRCTRGILCNGCNVGLGAFNDNLERMQVAIEYLSRWLLRDVIN